MTYKKYFSLGGFGLLAMPFVTHAAFEPIRTLIESAGGLIQQLTGVVASLALLVFFWGIVKYILSADDEKAKDSGKRLMIGGVIGLFVMFSVFGLVRFVQSAFGLQNSSQNPPTMTPPSITI